MFIRTENFREFIRYYPVVSTIVAIHIILHLMIVLPIFPNSLIFEKMLGVNLYIIQGEYWRLITPIFIHGGFAHLLFNSFSLILFGPGLERMFGKIPFISFYLATGILANIATLILKPLTYTHLGSSGAIFGLFGIYIAIVLFRKDLMSQQNSQMIITIIVIGLIMTFIQPNVNVTAHLFGAISGFILGTIFLGRGKELAHTVKSFSEQATRRRNLDTKSVIFIIIILLAVIGLFTR